MRCTTPGRTTEVTIGSSRGAYREKGHPTRRERRLSLGTRTAVGQPVQRHFSNDSREEPSSASLLLSRSGNDGPSVKVQRFSSCVKQCDRPIFVDPMDHSSRAMTGDLAQLSLRRIASGTASRSSNSGYYTLPLIGPLTQMGNRKNAAAHVPALADMREGAPARVYCIIADVFPKAKISVAARKQGVKVEFVKSARNLLVELARIPERTQPSLIVVDLNNANARPLSLIPRLRAKLKKPVSIIGIVSQVQGDLKVRGIKAGCDSVLSHPTFSRNLPNLLHRHAVEAG